MGAFTSGVVSTVKPPPAVISGFIVGRGTGLCRDCKHTMHSKLTRHNHGIPLFNTKPNWDSPHLTKLGSKLGSELGSKLSSKLGSKLGSTLGSQLGSTLNSKLAHICTTRL